MDDRYYTKYAAAAVRGILMSTGRAALLPRSLSEPPLDELDEEELSSILAVAAQNGIKLFDFKKTHRNLPRVHRTISFLKGIDFSTLLDVGSGRGVFLIPFLEEFPWVEVASIDLLDDRITMLSDLRLGGVTRLAPQNADVTTCPFAPKSFDVVTMLEVLEHIPDYGAAIRAAVTMAKKYVIVTVPSHEDDNPEHIHLLTKERLTAAFSEASVTRLSFGGVPGHLFMIATIGE